MSKSSDVENSSIEFRRWTKRDVPFKFGTPEYSHWLYMNVYRYERRLKKEQLKAKKE